MDNIAQDIEKTVNWYRSLKKDFNDVGTLISARRLLSCRFYDFGHVVSNAKNRYNAAEWSRKAGYIVKKQELIATGDSISKADAAAEDFVKDLRYDEMVAYNELQEVLLQYEGVKEVLSSMQQHISYLKDERRSEFSGTGSQEV